MSSIAVFVSDFRGAVSAMIDAYSRAATLAQFAATMGWTQEDFASVLSGSDINATQLMEALQRVGQLAAQYQEDGVILARLKP